MLLRKYLPPEEFLEEKVTIESSEEEALEEIEYMFYLKLEDFQQLERAKSSEKQYQYSLKFSKPGIDSIVRVRKSACTDGFKLSEDGKISHDSLTNVKYEVTSKVDIHGLDGKWELEREIDEHHYSTFYELAENGMIKDRYFFPIDGTDMVWEVDVFEDAEGNPMPWVKVDLEVKQRLAKIPEFPITYSEAVINQREAYTDKEKEFVDNFYKQVVIDLAKVRAKGPITTALNKEN